MTNEEMKERQKLRDARCHRRYTQPSTMPVLQPQIFAMVNKLPAVKRMRFLEAVHHIETLYPTAESREKAIHSLLESIFISKQTIGSVETIAPKDGAEKESI